jgi:hypothetical protein
MNWKEMQLFLLALLVFAVSNTLGQSGKSTLIGPGSHPLVAKDNFAWFINKDKVMRTDGSVQNTTQGATTRLKTIGISAYKEDRVFYYSQEPNTNVLYITDGTDAIKQNASLWIIGEKHRISSLVYNGRDNALLCVEYSDQQKSYSVLNVKDMSKANMPSAKFIEAITYDTKFFFLYEHNVLLFNPQTGQTQSFYEPTSKLLQFYISQSGKLYVISSNHFFVYNGNELIQEPYSLPETIEKRIVMNAPIKDAPDRVFIAQQKGLFLCDLGAKKCSDAFVFPGGDFTFALFQGVFVPTKGLLYFMHKPPQTEHATTMYSCDGTLVRRIGELIYPGPLAQPGNVPVFTGLRYVPQQNATTNALCFWY